LVAEAHKYPHEVSVASASAWLARALAPRPALLLLDEPFSNLDIDLRERLGLEVRALLRELATPALRVTHDHHEAFSIADRIGVMNKGRIEQWDTAYNLYHRPASRFVADFVGQGVLMRGRVMELDQIDTELGLLPHCPGCALQPGENVDVLLRPDDILHDDASPRHAEVLHKAFRGAEILYTLKLPSGAEVLSLVPSHHNHEIGQKIGIKLRSITWWHSRQQARNKLQHWRGCQAENGWGAAPVLEFHASRRYSVVAALVPDHLAVVLQGAGQDDLNLARSLRMSRMLPATRSGSTPASDSHHRVMASLPSTWLITRRAR
jgi:energy-coupling factor transporter ATP-binding protein EcfA2